MQCVGFESLAFVLGGDAAESAGTPPIDGHRDEHHGECPDGWFDLNAAEEQTHDRFVDDPDAGQQKQAGFDEGGEVLDLAVAILMVGVGGLVGDSDREICEQGGDQIQSRVRGFGEDAEAARSDADDDLSAGDEEGGDNRVSCHCAFFGAHGVGRVEGRSPGHVDYRG